MSTSKRQPTDDIPRRQGHVAEPSILRYNPSQGGVVLQIGSRRERFAHVRSPEQQIVAGDYHRARRGFSSDTEMAETLGVHRTRIAAWKKGNLPDRENANLLAALATAVDELLRFLDPEVIVDWLTTPQFDLQGQPPMAVLQQGRLADVLQAVNATEQGAFI